MEPTSLRLLSPPAGNSRIVHGGKFPALSGHEGSKAPTQRGISELGGEERKLRRQVDAVIRGAGGGALPRSNGTGNREAEGAVGGAGEPAAPDLLGEVLD
jgi:hypothetical protein